MKFVKLIGLAALAAMALMAFGTGTASATKLCKNNLSTTACSEHYGIGTTIDGTLTGSATLWTVKEEGGKKVEGTLLDTCTTSTVKGKTENTAATGEAVKGPIEALTWEGCTKTTETIEKGTLEISWISGTDNGTLISKGARVLIKTIFGTCTYGTSNTGTDLGTVQGGKTASISIATIVPLLKDDTGFGACPTEGFWTANYSITEPAPLYITHN